MINEKEKDPRVLRLREVYLESGYKSVNAFAKAFGFNQPTVANYMCGFRRPTTDFFIKLSNAMPMYNLEWLTEGVGDKYNRKYVEIKDGGDEPQMSVKTSTKVVVDDPKRKEDITERILSMAEKISSMAERLSNATMRCCELEEQLRKANEIIDKYKSTDELA